MVKEQVLHGGRRQQRPCKCLDYHKHIYSLHLGVSECTKKTAKKKKASKLFSKLWHSFRICYFFKFCHFKRGGWLPYCLYEDWRHVSAGQPCRWEDWMLSMDPSLHVCVAQGLPIGRKVFASVLFRCEVGDLLCGISGKKPHMIFVSL